MATEIHITLKPDDVEEGLPGVPDHCPVALAMNRCTKGLVSGSWEVTPEYLVWHRTVNGDTRWDTPPHVASWIRRFDKNKGLPERKGLSRFLLGSRQNILKFTLYFSEGPEKPSNKTAEVWQAEVTLARSKREAVK